MQEIKSYNFSKNYEHHLDAGECCLDAVDYCPDAEDCCCDAEECCIYADSEMIQLSPHLKKISITSQNTYLKIFITFYITVITESSDACFSELPQ